MTRPRWLGTLRDLPVQVNEELTIDFDQWMDVIPKQH